MSPDDDRHGTNAGYLQKCRCARCKAAHAEHKRARYHGELAPLPFAPLAPFWPRVIEVQDRGLRDAAEKAKERGHISVKTADRIAVALGTHPGLIWADEWWLTDVQESA